MPQKAEALSGTTTTHVDHLLRSLPEPLRNLELTELHRRIVEVNHLHNPYYDFAGQGEEPFAIEHRNGLEVVIGRIGAFPVSEVAAFIQASTQVYVEEGTMGDIDSQSPQAWSDLLAVFSEGFSSDDSFVMVRKMAPDGRPVIVGGCLIRPGKLDAPIKDLIGKPEATHSTLWSLNFEIPKEHATFDANALMRLPDTPEDQTYTVSRFFRLNNTDSGKYGVTIQDAGNVVLELIAGVEVARKHLGQPGKPLLDGIADIHDDKFAKLVSEYGLWYTLSYSTSPTPQVMNTILRHHYGFFTQENQAIKVVCGYAKDTIRAAQAITKKLVAQQEATAQKISQLEKDASHNRIRFIEAVNSGKLAPRLFRNDSSFERQTHDQLMASSRSITTTDTRMGDLLALYKRFHTQAKRANPEELKRSNEFTHWLNQQGYSEEKCSKLVIPISLENGRISYEVINVLPPNLHRQVREASANKLFDQEVKDLIYNDLDVVMVGASVGSQAAVMLNRLGAQRFSLVDYDDQDGVGAVRMATDNAKYGGWLKVYALRDALLRANPYAQIECHPQGLTQDNINQILAGQTISNLNRRLMVVEQIDSKSYKDLVRQRIRELYPHDPSWLIFSLADLGQSMVAGQTETALDEPYLGNALKAGANDVWGNGLSTFGDENIVEAPIQEGKITQEDANSLNTLAQIIGTYGLITLESAQVMQEVGLPPEMAMALFRLLQGEISSFEQSPLSTQLTGYFAGVALIEWLSGRMKNGRNIRFDGRWLLSETPEEVTQTALGLARQLQGILGIRT